MRTWMVLIVVALIAAAFWFNQHQALHGPVAPGGGVAAGDSGDQANSGDKADSADTSSTTSATGGKFQVVHPERSEAGLFATLATEHRKAAEAGQKTLVMFTASWCGPCQHFKRSFDIAQVKQKFAGVRIVLVDVDEWREDSQFDKIAPEFIPMLSRVDAEGHLVGRPINGEDFLDADETVMADNVRAYLDSPLPNSDRS